MLRGLSAKPYLQERFRGTGSRSPQGDGVSWEDEDCSSAPFFDHKVSGVLPDMRGRESGGHLLAGWGVQGL